MRLSNSMSSQLEDFVVDDNRVGVYVCGVTPYDTTHIGHAFTFLTFDVLVRYLRYHGFDVTYVQNVTDIDDDILRKSAELGMDWQELGRKETNQLLEDLNGLNAVPFDHFVAATQHIKEVIELVKVLVDKGFAYAVNGSVYFSVSKATDFGKLSHLDPNDMLPIANERGNNPNDPNKQDPIDFVLWQAAKPGEPTWETPWGPGRPGWHIECTAMAQKYLGETFAIHGGGYDLIFPHHECEIAQSENSTGQKPFVRTWMHVAMVDYQGEKMSKSLGNLVLARNVLQEYSSDAFRLYLHSNHYRNRWEYVDEAIETWAALAADIAEAAAFPAIGSDNELNVTRHQERFFAALEDDLNTPVAIEELHAITRLILEAPETDDIRKAQGILRELSGILGLTL